MELVGSVDTVCGVDVVVSYLLAHEGVMDIPPQTMHEEPHTQLFHAAVCESAGSCKGCESEYSGFPSWQHLIQISLSIDAGHL